MSDRMLLQALGIALVLILAAVKVEIPASSAAWVGPAVMSAEGHVGGFGKKMARVVREVTAYNVGERRQTSVTPCIGAGGHNLCELVRRGVKVCAANFVPLRTILHIEGHGDFIVLDRMNRRFNDRIDIAMDKEELEEAREFGVQRRTVEAKY